MDNVPYSTEWSRIARLPRRPVGQLPDKAELLPEVLRQPGSEATLFPVQLQALAEILIQGGGLIPVRVGGGKTLISFLAPVVLEAKRTVLLVPAKLREKTKRDWQRYSKDWQIPPVHVLSYEMLGHPQHADDLEDFKPDLIVADEAHRLKNPRAAVTRRVGRYMKKHPETRFVALSGTMTKRSLRDFSHLAEWALRADSPVPQTRQDVELWDRALKPSKNPNIVPDIYPRAILDLEPGYEHPRFNFGRSASGKTLAWLPNRVLKQAQQDAREIYHRRLAETPGVVVSPEEGIATSLIISRWSQALPEAMKDIIRSVRKTWELPDGQQILLIVDLWRHMRELAQGFWYRWTEPAPKEWLDARREWARFVRHKLQYSRTLDSPAQVARAYEDHPIYQRWVEVRDSFVPETEPVWISEEIVDAAVAWAERMKGLVWVEHRAVGEKLEQKGLTYFASSGIDRNGRMVEDHEGPAVLSIAANSEGRNLQRWSSNLVLSPPTTGSQWEQLLGRTHREGQEADEVTCEVYLGVKESVEGFVHALEDARYQQQVLGYQQKLLLADLVGLERT